MLQAFPGRVLVLCLLLVLAAPLPGQERYLAPRSPDGIELLAPPPAPGSAEEAADLNSARAVCRGRSPAEEARAWKYAGLSFSLFGSAIGPAFDLARLPRTGALLERVKKDMSEAINAPKNHWQRRRPYQMDRQLALGEPEDSYGYPSGHSTRGTVYSLVLAELFPEKREPILAVGREIGWDRVLLGKHFPTDIQAGRVLGKAVFRELLANAAFQRDLAQAREEVAALRRAAPTAEASKR